MEFYAADNRSYTVCVCLNQPHPDYYFECMHVANSKSILKQNIHQVIQIYCCHGNKITRV